MAAMGLLTVEFLLVHILFRLPGVLSPEEAGKLSRWLRCSVTQLDAATQQDQATL